LEEKKARGEKRTEEEEGLPTGMQQSRDRMGAGQCP